MSPVAEGGSSEAALAALAALPPLSQTLSRHGLLADKRLGQHFLFDLNICRKIVRLSGLTAGDVAIEVGPGPGGLTRALLEAGAEVLAIEKDVRFGPVLAELAQVSGGRLRVMHADALAVDEAAALREARLAGPARIIANLPYNIGTPLFAKWVVGAFRPKSMTLMFQAEVAERIVAAPGAEHYGRLAVLAQATTTPRRVMDLPASAFTPPPKVRSAVINATPLADRPDAATLQALQQVTAAAFGQRRKKLRSSLARIGGVALIAAAGIDPDVRAETVPVEGFIRLARCWLAAQSEPLRSTTNMRASPTG